MRYGRQIRRAGGGTRRADLHARSRRRSNPLNTRPRSDRAMKRELSIADKRRPGPFARIDDAVAAFAAGDLIIVVDDEDRENEGDLTIAAEKVTAESINFMARYGR